MIELTAIAEVWYSCELTEEDEQKVRELWVRNEIEIYTNSIESDFCRCCRLRGRG